MGRTDSRGRALLLLIAFAVVGAALLARLAYWQVGQRDRLADEAFQQTTMREETPSRRGDVYDRTGVVVLATTIERERLIGTPSELSASRRREVATALLGILGLTGDEATQFTARATSDRKYVVLAHALDTTTGDRIRAAISAGTVDGVALEPEPDPGGKQRGSRRGGRARPRAGPGLSAGRRRAEHDARGEAPRLREPRRRWP